MMKTVKIVKIVIIIVKQVVFNALKMHYSIAYSRSLMHLECITAGTILASKNLINN
jgi:hypothetical protein